MVPKIQDHKIGNCQLTGLDSLCDIKFSDSGGVPKTSKSKIWFHVLEGVILGALKNLEDS